MSILSITFHCEEHSLELWENYKKERLYPLSEKIPHLKYFIFSEVESHHLQEGKNTNFLLIFADENQRQAFMENELTYITEAISEEFGERVLTFVTLLNPTKSNLAIG
ncbi:DUF4286 family protein [Riemerella columbina]|uniref:DUF4286 family protein n=1 Tax=Riemerella columbina TaxID=103810 RepID=UPI00266EEDFF|nr:DUF4286 family protein [Riemerella columbina]WKS94612.1 DUF4286 family protein [Riemerella columbina]